MKAKNQAVRYIGICIYVINVREDHDIYSCISSYETKDSLQFDTRMRTYIKSQHDHVRVYCSVGVVCTHNLQLTINGGRESMPICPCTNYGLFKEDIILMYSWTL